MQIPTDSKANRMALEVMLLARFFPTMRLYASDADPMCGLVGELRTMAGNAYPIFVALNCFPRKVPQVYICRPLTTADGRNLAEFGLSHAWHLRTPHPSGLVQVCHYHDTRWTESVTLYKVLVKVLVWLEAYECARNQGGVLDDYVRTQG